MNKNLYEDLYALEDKHWWHIAKRETCLAFIKKYLKYKNFYILDIGCGTGKNLEEFGRIGKALGIDSSRLALKFCKEKRNLTNISFGSAEATGLAKETYNLVTLLDVLEHTNDAKALDEVSRILKKEGSVLITVPAYSWMWSQWDVVLHHKRRYTKAGLENILKQHGFMIIKSTYLYSFLLFPVFIIRKLKHLILKEEYSSDFKLGPPVVGKILATFANLERKFAITYGVPFGLSIIVVAKKIK